MHFPFMTVVNMAIAATTVLKAAVTIRCNDTVCERSDQRTHQLSGQPANDLSLITAVLPPRKS